MSNTFEENFYIRRNAEKMAAQQEEDDRRAIAGLFAVIAGIGLAIMIGITIIGAWAQ